MMIISNVLTGFSKRKLSILFICGIIMAMMLTTTTTATATVTEATSLTNDQAHDDPEQPHHNCTQWISNVFGDCVTNPLETSGFWMGIVSICIWVLAQFPQIVENIKRQDAGALSGLFLLMFFLADVIDVIGTVFIYAVGTQLYASIFYILMDVTLLLQWLYYKGKTTLKERKFRRQYSTAAVNNILNNYSDTHGGRSTYFSSTTPNQTRLMSSPGLLGNKKTMSSYASGTAGILSTTSSASNFGYGYYQSRPQQPPPPTRNLHNENDSSVFSVYSETDSEILAAYDTQEEDNLYQNTRTMVPNLRDLRDQASFSQTTPNRLSFLKEQTFTNSPRDSKVRLSALIFLPLILCSILLYTFAVQSTTTLSSDSTSLVYIRRSGSRSLLQFSENDQISQSNNGQIDGRGSLWPVTDGLGIGGYVLGWIAASIATISRVPQIVRNWSRKSTDGLSVFMFLLTILGNFTFCLSLFLFAAGSDFILAKLPWIIGAITSIILDSVIVFQCWAYYEKRYINIYDEASLGISEEE